MSLVDEVGSIVIAIISAVFGIIALVAAVVGNLFSDITIWERIFLLAITAVLTFSVEFILSIIGVLVFILFAVWKKQIKNKSEMESKILHG